MSHAYKRFDGRTIEHPGRKSECTTCRPRPLKTTSPAARLRNDRTAELRPHRGRTCGRCLAELGPDEKGPHCADAAACEQRQPPLFPAS